MNARTMVVGVLAVVCGLSAMRARSRRSAGRPSGPVIEKVLGRLRRRRHSSRGEMIQAKRMLELTREMPKDRDPSRTRSTQVGRRDRSTVARHDPMLDKGDLMAREEAGSSARARVRGMAALIKTGDAGLHDPDAEPSPRRWPGSSCRAIKRRRPPDGRLLRAPPDDEAGGASTTTTLLQNAEDPRRPYHGRYAADREQDRPRPGPRSVTLLVTPDARGAARFRARTRGRSTSRSATRRMTSAAPSPKPTTLADLQLPSTGQAQASFAAGDCESP